MSPRQTFPDTRERLRRDAVRDRARPVEWAILKDALRRPLTGSELECISELVELEATFIARARASRVTSRDIKRTLGALAAMAPDAAAQAYAHADDWTRTHVAGALRRAGIRDDEALAHPGGEQVVSAAKSAIASIAGLRGSRSRSRGIRTCNPRAVAGIRRRRVVDRPANDDFGTPIVRFAAAIFRAAGVRPCDLPTVAARLRSAV